jgi:DNA-binding MarR family transcriptional regulator
VALNESFERVGGRFGLSAQQAELLCAAMHPAPVGALARALNCDRSNVTRLAERAAARGWVQRRGDEHDGRVTVIELTPRGADLARAFIAALEQELAPLLADWSPQRRQQAVRLLDTLSGGLETAADEPLRASA